MSGRGRGRAVRGARAFAAAVAGAGLVLGAALVARGGEPPLAGVQVEAARRWELDAFGAVVRGDVQAKRLALVFTGDEFGESAEAILDALAAHGVRGSFFVTGRYVRDPRWRASVRRMVAEGHYVGPHSDGHLLYCDWDQRERNLVTEAAFADDLAQNVAALGEAGVPAPAAGAAYFIPPYEWYNRDQVAWSGKLGLTLVNFTPGSGSNRDYMREDHPRFVSSRQIRDDVLAYERKEPHGLNGFLLLLHLGSGRRDPFHRELPGLIAELAARGYELVRVDELLAGDGRP